MLVFNMYMYWFFFFFFMSLFLLFFSLYFFMYDFCYILEWNILSFNSISLDYLVYLDWLSLSFMFVVLFISSMVILYSSDYMGDYNYSCYRFLILVVLFVFSMLLMIISPNLVSILLGWDGLGLVSYLLVIYYSSLSSYISGMITCLTNRIGDIGLLISISWFFSFGSWNFIFYLDWISKYIYYMLIVSSFTKSAQIPFSCWLPAAMAAPTPVSSLVHSSTLVTAGVYLMIRFFYYSLYFNSYFIYISMMTMIMSSFCSIYEYDLKKIIALSTLSQLGLMMSSLFLGLVDLSYFHLLSHAMFKSLLFLCSGVMIYYMSDNQDIRYMGSFSLSLPFTSCCFNISNMSLFGFPFLSGFYSKDTILENSVEGGMDLFLLMLFYFSLGLTSFYSIRLFYYSNLYMYKGLCFNCIKEEYLMMKISLFILCLFSVVFGCSLMWLMNFDLGFFTFPFFLKVLSSLMVFLGIFVGYESMSFNSMFSYNYMFLNGSMWFLFGYSYFLYGFIYNLSINLINFCYWGEYYGPMGLSFYITKLSNFFQYYSLGSLKVFMVLIFIWLIFII